MIVGKLQFGTWLAWKHDSFGGGTTKALERNVLTNQNMRNCMVDIDVEGYFYKRILMNGLVTECC